MELSIALPCYNEEENIAASIADVDQWMQRRGIQGEIIVVDDGSKDGTKEVLREAQKRYPRLRVVTHPQNKGYGAAVRSGCDAGKTEWIGFMDSDNQFLAEDFDLLLEHTKEFPMIVGRRRKRADPFMRKMNAKCFGFLSWVLLGIWVRDLNCAMKIYRKDLWARIRPEVATGALFNAELFARAQRVGARWQTVDVRHFPRTKGTQTGANLAVILRMFKEIWTLRTTLDDAPPQYTAPAIAPKRS